MSFLGSLLGGIKAVFYNGTLQPQEPAINFTGAGVTVTDDPTNGFTTVTITGGAAGDRTFVTPQQFGAVGNGIADDSGAFIAMIAASVGKDILISGGNFLLSNNVTFSASNALYFGNGALITIGAGKTLTVGYIDADPRQIFAGTGSVVFLQSTQPCVWPDWWGSGTGTVQTAINAVGAMGIPIFLKPDTTYALGNGATGISVVNHNVKIIGQGGLGNPSNTQGSSILQYSGTGTAVQFGTGIGVNTTVFLRGCEMRHTFIQSVDNTQYGLRGWMLSDGKFEDIVVYGQSTSANDCARFDLCISTTFNSATLNGTGTAVDPDHYANGLHLVSCTTFRTKDIYMHGNNVNYICDTSFASAENCVFELSRFGYNAINNAKLEIASGWFEDVTTRGGGKQDGTSDVQIHGTHFVLYAGTSVVFNVNDGGHLTLWGNRYSAVGTASLFNSGNTTNNAIITLLDYPVFDGGTWTLTDNGGINENHSPNWRAANISALRVAKYTFNLNAIASNSSGAVPPDNAFSTNAAYASGAGYLLGLFARYSGTVSAGTIRLTAAINGTTKIDTDAQTANNMAVDHDALATPVAYDDALTVSYTTDVGFTTAGGDLLVELYVGYT